MTEQDHVEFAVGMQEHEKDLLAIHEVVPHRSCDEEADKCADDGEYRGDDSAMWRCSSLTVRKNKSCGLRLKKVKNVNQILYEIFRFWKWRNHQFIRRDSK